MPKVNVTKPGITPSEAMEVFRSNYAAKRGFDVYENPWWRGRDFTVKSSDSVGVSVNVKRGPRGSIFVFDGATPSTLTNGFHRSVFGVVMMLTISTFGLLGLVLIPIYRALLPTDEWKSMIEGITSFLENETAFKQQTGADV
jgi:hypothetical protein